MARPVSSPEISKEPERFAKALFKYDAKYQDELPLSEGELVCVVSTTSIEEGWYRARNSEGKLGIIPGNYVLFVDSSSANIREFNRPSSTPAVGATQDGGVPLLESQEMGASAYGRQRRRETSALVQRICFCFRD